MNGLSLDRIQRAGRTQDFRHQYHLILIFSPFSGTPCSLWFSRSRSSVSVHFLLSTPVSTSRLVFSSGLVFVVQGQAGKGGVVYLSGPFPVRSASNLSLLTKWEKWRSGTEDVGEGGVSFLEDRRRGMVGENVPRGSLPTRPPQVRPKNPALSTSSSRVRTEARCEN